MKNLETVEALLRASKSVKTSIEKYNEYQKNTGRYDKTGFSFNRDSRFAACKPLTLSVDSWMGVYGDSNCGNILSVDAEIFNKHLLSVLRSDFWDIMNKVSESISKEAVTLKQEAQKELEEKLELVKSL